MKKKLFAAALAICLLVSMAIPAFADKTISGEDVSDAQEWKTTVQFKQDESYTFIIPSQTDLNAYNGDAKELEVKASNVYLASNKTLTITVSSKEGWRVVSGSTGYTYELRDSSNNKVTGTVLTVKGGNTSGSVTLKALLTQEVKLPGTYTDTLTFTVSVK